MVCIRGAVGDTKCGSAAGGAKSLEVDAAGYTEAVLSLLCREPPLSPPRTRGEQVRKGWRERLRGRSDLLAWAAPPLGAGLGRSLIQYALAAG